MRTTQTIGMRVSMDFPLKGVELKSIVENFGTIFMLAVQDPAKYADWAQLPQNAEIVKNIDILITYTKYPGME